MEFRALCGNGFCIVLPRKFAILVAVTVTEADNSSSTEKLILRALILSLLLHLLVFGTWKIGMAQGWWNNLALPRWMQLISKALLPAIPKKPVQLLPQTPTVFVEVDPDMIAPQPPTSAKFYGANNTVAANKEIKAPSLVPNIEGRQDKVMKTTEDAKPKAEPLQPTPPPQPQPTPSQPPPKKSYTPGDLAMAPPAKKPEDKDGKTDSDSTPQPQPQPAYQRPRTLAEAMARHGTLGEQSRQSGGVPNLSMKSSLDVKGSAIGGYDEQVVAAIKARWYQLLENRSPNAPGKVVVEFRMHPDGRITDVKVTQNEVSELLAIICQQAILDPAPYPPWPKQMRLDIPADVRDVQFTFYYMEN
jgi:hypothetical protein